MIIIGGTELELTYGDERGRGLERIEIETLAQVFKGENKS
jgi:hypothetical protein